MPRQIYSADASQAERALLGFRKAEDEVAKGAAKVGQNLTIAEKKARRFAEQANPIKKYERNMRDVAVAVQKGGLAQKDALVVAQRIQTQYDRVSESGSKAYGSRARNGIKLLEQSWSSVGLVVGGVSKAVADFATEQTKAQEAAKQGAKGIGSLAQLAVTMGDTPAARRAAQYRLERESLRTFAKGAATSVEGAANLTFKLNSAGLSRADRDFLVEARSRDLISDPGAAATGIAALQSSYKISTEDLFSKGLAVSRVAPASVDELVLSVAKQGASLKALGFSEDFGLASEAVLAKTFGSASEGATRLGGLLTGLQKVALQKKPSLAGKSGLEVLAYLESQGIAEPGPRGYKKATALLGGDKEGIQGARTLISNRGLLADLVGESAVADDQQLARQALGLADQNPVFSAGRTSLRSNNRREVERLEQSELSNLVQAARDDSVAYRREKYGDLYGGLLNAVDGVTLIGQNSTGETRQIGHLLNALNSNTLTSDTEEKIVRALFFLEEIADGVRSTPNPSGE